ncbi:MAG: hypothetical protein KJN84_12865 [Bacteroidia bacterium]|nr:hypothetical protein [Bacteroidia bacterium]
MARKAFDFITIILFTYFMIVQLNDDDGSQWIMIYGVMAFIGILSITGRLKQIYPLFAFSFLLGYSVFNFNLFISWLDAGKPAFIDYEPTNIQAVENIREYLGIVISLIFAFIYLLLDWRSKKRRD